MSVTLVNMCNKYICVLYTIVDSRETWIPNRWLVWRCRYQPHFCPPGGDLLPALGVLFPEDLWGGGLLWCPVVHPAILCWVERSTYQKVSGCLYVATNALIRYQHFIAQFYFPVKTDKYYMLTGI